MKDDLMGRAMGLLSDSLSTQRGVQLWLHEAWKSFLPKSSRGHLNEFVDVLHCCENTYYFVPTRSFKQGSPNNPYLQQKRGGYNWEVEPSKLASALMTWREELADEWRVECLALAKTTDSTKICRTDMADSQRLEGLATRIAILELLHDRKLLPSQGHTCAWLVKFLKEHEHDLAASGSVEHLLADLRGAPLMIRTGNLLDPLQLADEIQERTVPVELDMADVLEATSGEHCLFKSNFLERCLLL